MNSTEKWGKPGGYKGSTFGRDTMSNISNLNDFGGNFGGKVKKGEVRKTKHDEDGRGRVADGVVEMLQGELGGGEEGEGSKTFILVE